jgi:hypothetical protein
MKADFSRLTFAGKNHYRRVLMQQGRVEIDADGNEQVAIAAHIAATTSTDVIGRAGYPLGTLPDGNPAGGFALGLSPAGSDLTISPGRMYVDGVLVENDTPGATLLTQPEMPGVTLAALGATQAGFYAVYLDVWERLITALDDPAIRESALGGPDTSVRTKVTWQVKLALLPAAAGSAAALPTCASAGEPWRPATGADGMLAAGSAPPGSTLPCILPPETGYQRLENQLYRVEIHTPGPDGTATFKWSRENGSVVALISAPPTVGGTPVPATVTGPSFWVTSLSSDPSLGLQAGDWVELTDDGSELIDGHGALYPVHDTPTDGHTVTITAASPPTVTLALHPKLRRWDQAGPGLDQGIKVTTGAPIPLEGGVQVQFSAGTYRVGDYWLIPARTATSVQQGFVEWPVDASSNPLPRPPLGIQHRYAMLGLVELTAAQTFAGLGTATTPTDCRLPFPPLTSLMPTQSRSPCTIVVQPGPGWEQPILTYFAGAGEAAAPLDAEICFPVGDFPVINPVVISNAGHVQVNGAGWGTRLVAAANSTAESVLTFTGCSSVAVRDLYGETSKVISTRGSAGRNHINGTLAFSNCGEVTVEDVWLRCGSALSLRGAACISVASDIRQGGQVPSNAATGTGSVRIRGCRLHVGEMQVGIQLIHQARATVEDNEISVDPAIPATTLGARLADSGYLAIARGYLISQATLTTAPAPASPPGPAAPAAQVAKAEASPARPDDETTQAFPAIPAAEPAASAAAEAGQPSREGLAGPGALLARSSLTVSVGNQTLSFVAASGLESTWQTFLNANAPKAFATPADALRYVKTAADTILTTPAARAGLSGFGGILHILNEHVPLAGRGIVVGGQAIGDLHIVGNTISDVLLGISVAVSHRASATETKAKQRTPDHMQTIRIASNTIACSANDVAGRNARFGVFVGNANSLEIEGNRLTLTRAGITVAPPADAIRVVGYLGPKAVIRHNYVSSFAMGIRVVPLTGNGPGTRAPVFQDFSYLAPIRFGSQWLVADNFIEGASARVPPIGPFWKTKNTSGNPAGAAVPNPYIDAPACMRVNNAHS